MLIAEFWSDTWTTDIKVSSYEEAKARALGKKFRVLHVDDVDGEVFGIMEEDSHGVFFRSIDGIDYL